ncbi:type II toxin-antitoxin system PemK/MazF family toxin [Brachyspira sp.]|uniref:type II toxin-antitoxin system PemK/MazF family toxin n=1 Tax=Brachyspira sp. TaxID=1977261 RepID=UPI003D7EF118
MTKYVIEAQNTYSKGHEQMNKRPYLVIYDSNDYILGFPTTTKNKKSKQYPSHKNPTINTRDGLSEVMIDQLQLIYKKYFTQTNKFLIQNSEYMVVIESFINQIIKNRKNPKRQDENCPNFFDVIHFTHNIPEFLHFSEWLVISTKHFNIYTKMCFIIPNDTLDLAYLHSIDWETREVRIINKKYYTNDDIQTLKEKIRNHLIGN